MGGTVLAENLRNREDPFQLTADPKFCYLDPTRRHASARLLSGLYAGDGLFTLTGRAGIGKSILLRHLSEQLNGLDVVYPLTGLLVFSCRTGTALGDILGACESRLGLGESTAAPLKAAKRLQQLVEDARSPVLLLDDADLLGDDVLEAIVTLSGLQASDRSLLSVVMAGHTSIVARLAAIGGPSAGNSDRVVNLEPMMEADAARLIRHRLRMAEHPEGVFANDAIARILRHSAGVPLNIVRVCRRAMQLAERRSLKSVTADLVTEAISEEFPGGSRESGRSPSGGAPAAQQEASHSRSLRPTPIMLAAAPERPAEAHQLAITPPLADLRAVPHVAEPRAEPRAEPPPMRPDAAPASEPSLLREPHMSIPDVTLGRPTRARSGERTTRDYADGRRRRNGRRVKFTLAGGGLLLVLLAAGLIALMGSTRPLSDAARTSATAGLQGGSASPADQTQEDWWQPPTTVTSRAPVESDFGVAGTEGHNPLPGLASVDVGRMPDPIASDAIIGAGRSDPRANLSEGGSMSTGAHAPIAPETVSPSFGKETQPDPAAASTRTEPASRSEAVPPTAAVAPTKEEPQPKPAAQAAKPAGPQAKSAPMQAKAPPVRNREIDNLLAEGDARLAEGDLEAARSAYELAYDKGSRIAALRMAQTFDPRTAPGTKKSASPAEAILWYQDAARKGDRGAREELDNLATWLENDAASGSAEARRVLDLWRTPAEPADSFQEPTQ